MAKGKINPALWGEKVLAWNAQRTHLPRALDVKSLPRSYLKHLQNLVTVMVDDLHGELARLGFVVRSAPRASLQGSGWLSENVSIASGMQSFP